MTAGARLRWFPRPQEECARAVDMATPEDACAEPWEDKNEVPWLWATWTMVDHGCVHPWQVRGSAALARSCASVRMVFRVSPRHQLLSFKREQSVRVGAVSGCRWRAHHGPMAGFGYDLARWRLVCEQHSHVECWATTCVRVQVRVCWMCVCVARGRSCGRAQGVYVGTVVMLL